MTLSDTDCLEMPGHLLQGLDPDCISHRQRSQTQNLFNNDLPGIAAVMVQENPYKGSQGCFNVGYVLMILPQVHLRKPCYDFYFL
jgi:hypothetical protein